MRQAQSLGAGGHGQQSEGSKTASWRPRDSPHTRAWNEAPFLKGTNGNLKVNASGAWTAWP